MFFHFYFLFFGPACIDHRGTPENPARTLTLEQEEGAICVRLTTDLHKFNIEFASFNFSISSLLATHFFSETFCQWGAAYCVRGTPERERAAMEVI